MKTIKTVLLMLLGISCKLVIAQTTDYKYQAMFVYNIAKLAQWDAGHNTAGEFKIAVLGNPNVTTVMSQFLDGRKVGNQSIKVESYNGVDDIATCHILFVPANTKNSIEKLMKATENRNIMLVTERDGWGKKGSTINFVLVDGKMKFEVNTSAAQRANIKLSNSLTAMGIVL